jgi:hypothetical protein
MKSIHLNRDQEIYAIAARTDIDPNEVVIGRHLSIAIDRDKDGHATIDPAELQDDVYGVDLHLPYSGETIFFIAVDDGEVVYHGTDKAEAMRYKGYLCDTLRQTKKIQALGRMRRELREALTEVADLMEEKAIRRVVDKFITEFLAAR